MKITGFSIFKIVKYIKVYNYIYTDFVNWFD